MINEIAYEQVLKIRHIAMYPEKEVDYVILPDDNRGLHIGYHVDEIPVSVFSLFLNNGELQFRKFATLPEYQNKGYGTKLMKWLIDYADDMKFGRIWCNARTDKSDFYKKFGFAETDNHFEKDGYKYVIMERKPL